jgi:hypothetical protein
MVRDNPSAVDEFRDMAPATLTEYARDLRTRIMRYKEPINVQRNEEGEFCMFSILLVSPVSQNAKLLLHP